jgi:hypothetical protein
MRMTETNKDNITALTNKQFVYTTSNNGNLRLYVLKGVERIGDGFAVVKVLDKSHDRKIIKKTLKRGLTRPIIQLYYRHDRRPKQHHHATPQSPSS